jgi:hypothetical protein
MAEYQGQIDKAQLTIDEVNRVLEVGRLLWSVLSVEEREQIRKYLSNAVKARSGSTLSFLKQ